MDSEGPEDDDQNEEEEVDDVDEDELEEAQREIQEAHSHGGVSMHSFERLRCCYFSALLTIAQPFQLRCLSLSLFFRMRR